MPNDVRDKQTASLLFIFIIMHQPVYTIIYYNIAREYDIQESKFHLVGFFPLRLKGNIRLPQRVCIMFMSKPAGHRKKVGKFLRYNVLS